MIFNAAQMSVANLFQRETRQVVLKVLAATLLTLVVLWVAIQQAYTALVWPYVDALLGGLPDWGAWVTFFLSILSTVGIAVGVIMLMAPVTTLVAGIFLDDVAEAIEKRDYPTDNPGMPLPLGASILSALKFSGVVLGVNLLALVFYFIPGVNVVVFFVVNGYLIGREYFEFAAMRHMRPEEARKLRNLNATRVTLAGCVAALMLAIPFVNLLTPIFAAGMMVHLYKSIALQAAARA